MWYNINDQQDIVAFMDAVYSFHDSCIKEMHYLSGAYVTNELAMYPINEHRVLSVIIQRQSENRSVIEMEFSGLKLLKLSPIDAKYSCEILDSTLLLYENDILWCDSGNITEKQMDDFQRTIIRASKLRWRVIKNGLGQNTFYNRTGDGSKPLKK